MIPLGHNKERVEPKPKRRPKPMCRIDVTTAGKNKFKVLVNFCQRGIEYASSAHANQEAKAIHAKNPTFNLNLLKDEEK